jgi:ketosteroid isomerase-like protein
MRYLAVAVLMCLVSSGAAAQPAGGEVMAPIQKFVDAFNKGDVAGAAATHVAADDLVIIDEVPPYVWRGAQAFHAWAAALDAENRKAGITEPSVSISAPTRREQNGDQAYVIVPAVYSFKQGGTAMRAAAQMTFVLKKGASGWLIHGWTWTGPKPAAAGR